MSTDPNFSPEAIAEALREATPGPWVGVIKPNGKGTGLVGVKAKRGTGEQGCIAVINSIPGGKERVANTKLLGNAPTWLAQLLAALEAKDGELGRLRRLLSTCYGAGIPDWIRWEIAAALSPTTPPDLEDVMSELDEAAEMERAIACLAVELPGEVWVDVRDKWHAARDRLERIEKAAERTVAALADRDTLSGWTQQHLYHMVDDLAAALAPSTPKEGE